MYFPNIEWEAVRIEGVFEDDINQFACDGKDAAGVCTVKQDQDTNIPDDLFAEIEQQVLAEILPQTQLPPENTDNKQNIFR